MIKNFKHFIIYIYLFSLLLNINLINFYNIEISNKIFSEIFNEILLIDIIILIFSIAFYKDIITKIKEVSSLLVTKIFYSIFFIGLIGILFSIIFDQDKTSNIFFLILFYLNSLKIFIGLIIFLVLIEKQRFILSSNFYFFTSLSLVLLITLNFLLSGDISRLYYPFTNKTNGYNLLGLVSGVFFFMALNSIEKTKSISLKNLFVLLIYFFILLFCFSKTSIFSFIITFIFYYLILNKNISRQNMFLSIILIIVLILFLDAIKYVYETNSLSFIDIILNPFTWINKYASFYFRIEHVWLSNFDKDLNLFIFFIGEGIYSPKIHDSLYFSIISRFGFLGIIVFFYFLISVYTNSKVNRHSVLTYCLIFGVTSEMIMQSNVINPLIVILIYINFSKKIILR